MAVFVINPEYVVNEMDDSIVLFTADMEKIYIFNDVEKIILNAFVDSIDLRHAVKEISAQFNSFDENECIEYIEKLISERVLVEC